jgi:hypothetical protein
VGTVKSRTRGRRQGLFSCCWIHVDHISEPVPLGSIEVPLLFHCYKLSFQISRLLLQSLDI